MKPTRPKSKSIEGGSSIICGGCNTDFFPVRGNQIYCSKKCKTRERDRRERKAKPEKCKAYRQSYYQKNKHKWQAYKEKQIIARENDPERAAKEKKAAADRCDEYRKRNPGLQAINRQLNRDAREGEDRYKRIYTFGSRQLLAAARLILMESRKIPEAPSGTALYQNEKEILKIAALILTAIAGEKIVEQAKINRGRKTT